MDTSGEKLPSYLRLPEKAIAYSRAWERITAIPFINNKKK